MSRVRTPAPSLVCVSLLWLPHFIYIAKNIQTQKQEQKLQNSTTIINFSFQFNHQNPLQKSQSARKQTNQTEPNHYTKKKLET
jgi:hypothetical protein